MNWLNKVHFGDCLETLRQMPDGIVNTCVTSPPYFGLRSYGGGDAEIGKEKTPEEFIAALVAVFHEVRRVLRDDGTCFINIGDSYFSGSQRAAPCGTSGKAPVNSQGCDCLCGSLCDACRKAYRIGKSHNDFRRAPMQEPSLCATSHAHTELPPGHPPTLDSLPQAGRSSTATLGSLQKQGRAHGQLPCAPVSSTQESSLLPPGECLQAQCPDEECQLCGCSLQGCVPVSVRMAECRCDKALRGSESDRLGMGVLDLAYPYSTTAALKHKDLIGIPWMLAFALRADGWYLRQEIIWAKPNPMPESVRDRCTKSHEQIFLLAKSQKYYCDMGAIKEPVKQDWGTRSRENGKYHKDGTGLQPHTGLEKSYEMANKRSVWTVSTKPYSGAHFAVFPADLIEPCILAGAPAGGVVLDPFMGSGTTAKVAQNLGRQWIGCELNPAYAPLQNERIAQMGMILEVNE